MMTFEELKTEYRNRYACEAYQNDEPTKKLLALIESAEKLTPAAQVEFVQAFDYENALDGELYLGSRRMAPARFPHLLSEATAAGITLVTR